MATIAYLRVSIEGQDLDQQRLAILDYAQKYRVTVNEFVATLCSSKHASQRTELMEMIEALRPGDRLIVTKAMITLFGLFAEVERSLIAQRTKEGLAAAKARGKRLGRPKGAMSTSKLDGKEGEIRSLLQKNVSKASIVRITRKPFGRSSPATTSPPSPSPSTLPILRCASGSSALPMREPRAC